MKLLFITTLSHIQWGGSEELWTRTAQFCVDKNIEVELLIYDWPTLHPKLASLTEQGAKIHVRNTEYNRSFLTRAWKKLSGKKIEQKQLHQLIIKNKPDAIIISQGGTFDLGFNNQDILTQFLLETKIPFYIICQNNADVGYVPQNEVRDKIHSLFNTAKLVLFVSKRNMYVAERQLPCNLPNARTISNPVNLKDISIQPWNETDTVQFSIVAALKCSHKGQDFLFEILASEKWKNRDWKLNLYGKGEDETYLKTLAKHYNLEERIEFHGHLEDISEVWKHNHILLLPSLGEGMPLALQEAMLCGRSAVVTDVAGSSELIINKQTGYLAGAPTVKLFASALEDAWMDRKNWKKMGENAFAHAQSYIDINPEKTLLDIIINVK